MGMPKNVMKIIELLKFGLLSSLYLLSSCGFKTETKGSHVGTFISGVITPFLGSISQNTNSGFFIQSVAAAACSEAVYAKLYKLESDGTTIDSNPLASQVIGADARYSFDLKLLSIANQNSKVNYIVKAVGCNGEVYKRPVTDFDNKQDIDAKSTVVAEVINASNLIPNKLNEVSRSDVEILIKSLSGSSTNAALNSLISDNSTKFSQIFGASPAIIQQSRPEVILNTPSSIVNELAVSVYTVNAFHVDPNYSFAYKWKLDGIVVSSQNFFNYIPSANSSGTHQIDLYVGKDDGSGNIDLTIPYYSKTYSITVNNNILPVAPDVAINSATPSPRSTNNIQLDLSTGIALTNCSTFSHLAFSETNTVPGIMQFNVDCNSSGTQTETVSFSSLNGSKTIYVWAIDKEGIVSSSKSVNLILDTIAPTATISAASSALKGGSSNSITLSSSDNASGLQSLEIFFTSDGITYTSIATPAVGSTSLSWNTPSINSTTSRLKILATDQVGWTTTTYSSIFSIDSTAPNAPAFSAATASPTSSTVASVTIGSCGTDIDQILLTESSIQPTGIETGWQNCSTTAAAHSTTLTGEGSHTIYAWAKDNVGNIAASANSISIILDQTIPALSLDTTLSGQYSGGSTQTINWTASDANAVTIALEYFDGSAWTSVISGLSNTGNYSWTLPSLNSNQAKIKLIATDQAGNQKAVIGPSAFTIDSSPPAISSIIINDGASYAGTSIVSLKVNTADNFSSASQISLFFATANVATSDCQSEYVNPVWENYTNSTTAFLYSIVPTDGLKKICVWAKDAVGNISEISSPSTGIAGINYDTIEYQTGTPPTVTSFQVTKTAGAYMANAGDAMTINWQVSDTEELASNPISISYTTDNVNWKDIVTNLNISSSSNITWLGNLGTGATSGSGTITTWTAPSSGYFRLKAQAKDVAGNTSNIIMSQPINTGSWSVYAGNKDRGNGGTGRAATLYGSPRFNAFAINPKNGDIYAYDEGVGIRKLDAKTGLVSTFITNGTLNLPDDGALPAAPKMPIGGYINPVFDSKGRLYLASNYSYSVVTIFQIDLENSYVRRYSGGGTSDDEGVPSTSLRVASSGMSFDEQDSLYLFTLTAVPTTTAELLSFGKRIIKITQNADGTPGVTSRVIGNGLSGTITSGQLAINQPASVSNNYTEYTGITAWDNGNKILVHGYNNSVRYKIINGVVYSTNINAAFVNGVSIYNRADGYIYKTTSSGGIEKVLINASGANGDVSTTIFSGNSTNAGCAEDGTAITNFCGKIDTQLQLRSGILYFTDGISNNSGSNYSIRFFDNTNKLRTLFGSKPFNGDGIHRNMAKGNFASIYYKKSTEADLTAFPEGLYFMESNGFVFGRINTDDTVSQLWGNQARIAFQPADGITVSKDINMGAPYAGGDGMVMSFDNEGHPWVRTALNVIKIGSDNKTVRMTYGTSGSLQLAANNANPQNYQLWVYGGRHNFTLKNQGLFVAPNYIYNPGYDPIISLRYMNFSTLTTPIIIGGNYLASTNTAASADITNPGDVAAAPLWTGCRNFGTCFLQYNSSNDRLYVAENNKLRYITTPDVPATSTLITEFTLASGSITNFSFTPDNSQVWYFKNTGGLYCYDISSGKSWCDNTTDHFSIRSSAGFAVSPGPNQMTFKDDQTLFVSTYSGEILKFDLPTTP